METVKITLVVDTYHSGVESRFIITVPRNMANDLCDLFKCRTDVIEYTVSKRK